MIVLRDQLKNNSTFRESLQEKIKYTLVDEYQDINNIQREIIELITNKGSEITVVGEDSQSIYSFRGANFENILRFPESFPNAKAIKIEENYRSEQGVLNFTNDIIKNAKIGFKKELHSQRNIGKKPQILKLADSEAEEEIVGIMPSQNLFLKV